METIREEHPSFGMVGISHANSSGTALVGSEFKHHSFMTLTIRRAEKHRDLSREWWFARDKLIEIRLSEAQFVELVGRTNMGDGTCCTLDWVAGEQMPDPPNPVSEREKFRADMKSDAMRCTVELREAHAELVAAIDSGKIGKAALRKIAKKIEYAGYAVSNGIPFVEKSFEEKIESTINHATTEIEATVASLAMRLGIGAMQEIAAHGPRLIDQPVEPTARVAEIEAEKGGYEPNDCHCSVCADARAVIAEATGAKDSTSDTRTGG
jgi:hypothetical protein